VCVFVTDNVGYFEEMRAADASVNYIVVDVFNVIPPDAQIFLDDLDFNLTSRGNFVIEPMKRRAMPMRRHILCRRVEGEGGGKRMVSVNSLLKTEILQILLFLRAPGADMPPPDEAPPPRLAARRAYAAEVAEDLFNRFVGM
jgi:hypothetical protein